MNELLRVVSTRGRGEWSFSYADDALDVYASPLGMGFLHVDNLRRLDFGDREANGNTGHRTVADRDTGSGAS